VTILSEISPIRHWHFLKIAEVAFWLLLPTAFINCDENRLGFILGNIFKKTHLVTLYQSSELDASLHKDSSLAADWNAPTANNWD
jgi:hypothetical protein